jgi:hypothetical protein
LKKYLFLFLIFFAFCGNLRAQDAVKWKEFKGTHLIVYYKNTPEDFVGQVAEKAEYYYNAIADALGFNRHNFWLWDNRASIYIYDNAADYASFTKQPSWSAGNAVPEKKEISSYPGARDFVAVVLPHEMGHIIFREFVGFTNYAVPLWLDEGVASFQQKSGSSAALSIIKQGMANGGFIKLQDLSGFSLEGRDSASVKLFYAEAFEVVNFLIKEFGKDRFVLFCQNLRDKKDLNRALASAYSFGSLLELGSAWDKYLKK